MNKQLKQRFSIAVSFGEITPKDYIDILNKYKEYIHDIYYSPTDSLKYQTRKHTYNFYSTTNEERRNMLQEVITFAHSNNIKCCLTLNSAMISVAEQVDILEEYLSLMYIDFITTTLKTANAIKQRNISIPLICSYNEAITNKEHLKHVLDAGVFEAIVLGGKFLRDIITFECIKKIGIKTILMLNTGCCTNCTSYCKNTEHDYCKNLFMNNMKRLGAETMYAQQSVFPEEIRNHYLPSNAVDFFKLASRPITARELKTLLSSYIELDSKSYIEKSVQNYHLYGRLAYFTPFYNQFDYESISNIKQTIWDNNM